MVPHYLIALEGLFGLTSKHDDDVLKYQILKHQHPSFGDLQSREAEAPPCLSNAFNQSDLVSLCVLFCVLFAFVVRLLFFVIAL